MFTKLEKVYGNLYCKKYIMEKFQKLKIGSRFFNIFYSEFIKLAVKFKLTKKILLLKFMHKLSSYMQNRMNSRLEYLDNIKDLAVYCWKIYDQILATD